LILGLTGGYCAGKNTVAAILERSGWHCIDVDRLGHEAMELSKPAIAARFGAAALRPDGALDRRALARIVFADPAALADQEAIVHPVAIRLMEERIAAEEAAARSAGREPRVCINAALLHRTERVASCEAIIEVRAPFLVRVARGARRDGAGWSAALRRITRQRGFGAALRAAARASGRPIIALRNCGGRAALARALDRKLAGALEGASTRIAP
jgi:dephospho-CoA kinase